MNKILTFTLGTSRPYLLQTSTNQNHQASLRKFSQILKADLNDNTIKNGISEIPQWKICASLCLMRLPIIAKQLNDLEQEYEKLTEQLEFEKSIYSNWELEKMRQSNLIKQVQTGKISPLQLDFKVTKQSIEDDNKKNLKDFKEKYMDMIEPTTDDDIKSLERLPDQTLALIVQRKLGNDIVWSLPQTEWEENESMKQCAEKTLLEYCGLNAQYQATILSNAPSGFFKYKIPKSARSETDMIGVKEFIFNTVLNRYDVVDLKDPPGRIKILDKEDILDYAWVAQHELKSYVKPKYYNIVKDLFL